MDIKRKSYTPEFKLKVVLESIQRDTTQEEVCKKFGVSSSMLHRWLVWADEAEQERLRQYHRRAIEDDLRHSWTSASLAEQPQWGCPTPLVT